MLSLALGTSPVTLKEMVTAYSTLANEGRYIEPLVVTRVEDRNGRVLESFAFRRYAGALGAKTDSVAGARWRCSPGG